MTASTSAPTIIHKTIFHKTRKALSFPIQSQYYMLNTQWNTYSAIKKNKTIPFVATWMQLGIMILSEVSQKGKNKYCIIYMCDLKYDIINIFMNQKQTHRQNRLMVAKKIR